MNYGGRIFLKYILIFLKLNSYYCIAHQHSFIDYQIKLSIRRINAHISIFKSN
jgi:ABC-type uncharacterized transport system substrate-binding protein